MTGQRILSMLVSLVCLAVIVLLSCWVRIVNLQESLWLDELHTSWSVSGNLVEVAARAADGNQAPLYYWAEWQILQFLGQHEYSLRMISLLAGISLVPVVAWLVWRGTNSVIAGLVAALLVAIDPDLIFLSLEARPYALVSLIGLLQLAAFARLLLGLAREQAGAVNEKLATQVEPMIQPALWPLRLCFAGLTVTLFYLHYTTILILFAEVLLWAVAQLIHPVRIRYSITKFSADLLIVGVCCLPALPHLLDIAARKDDWSSIARTSPINPAFLRMLAAYAIPVSAVSLIWIFARGCVYDKTKWQFKPLSRVAIFGLGFLILFAAVWLTTKYQLAALLLPRYITVVFVAPLAAAGLSIGLFRNPWLQATLAVSIVAVAFSVNYWFNPWFRMSVRIAAVLPMHSDENWRSAVGEINFQNHAGRETIFLMSALVEDHRLANTHENEPPDEQFVEYCKFPLQGIYRVSPERFEIIPLPSAPFTGEFADNLLTQVENQGGGWIVSRDPRVARDVYVHLQSLIELRGFHITIQPKTFGNLITLQLKRR